MRGRYTAPASLSSWQGVTVTATSVADPKISAFRQGLGISSYSRTDHTAWGDAERGPVSGLLSQRRERGLPREVDDHSGWNGHTPTLVKCPIRSPRSRTALGTYIAPSIITSAQTVTLTATSVSDNSKTQSVKVNLVPSVAVSISPGKAALYGSQSQQFSAALNYRSSLAVTWSISPNVGAIQASGPAGLSASYTAPASITQPQTITITATGPDSGGGPCVAKATVTLMPK